MASGVFKLFVKPSEHQPWGLLESFQFDDASKKRRMWRERVLAFVRKCQMRWYYNYAQFRQAAFACEEQVDEYSSPVHVFGTNRDRKDRYKVPGGLKRKMPKKKIRYQTATKKTVKARNAKRSKKAKGKRRC